jgi:hypothetical protein
MGQSEAERSVIVPTTAVPRAVVVTDRLPTPNPLASGYEAGFTEQVVAWAGTVQETVTVAKNPKNGVTPMSFMYDAVFPAVTVCEVIPRFAILKSITRFKGTDAEVEGV